MTTGKASHRLVKDLLFDFVVKAGHKCYRCNGELTRDTFSIEHKKAWLDSGEPVQLFFDLDNIAFSHMKCNFGAAKKMVSKFTKEELLEKDRNRKKAAYWKKKNSEEWSSG